MRSFLAAARLWADHIIVADQQSSDGTLEELQRTSGVDVAVNEADFDEEHRQKLLFSKAREIKGKRILFRLDADEALSANCAGSEEWKRIDAAQPGTVLRFRWVNILPGFRQAWIPKGHRAFAFIDDGSEHKYPRIHGPRVPHTAGAPVMDFDDIVVLHFQYAVWDRMVSKHRWYQAWEHAIHKQKGALDIFREYHHMDGDWNKDDLHPLQPEWLQAYDAAGIKFRSLQTESITWWDREIVQMLNARGPEYFRRISIWDKDWNALAHAIGFAAKDLSDPRTTFERCAHALLKRSQGYRGTLPVRAFERFLRLAGW